MDTFRRCCPIPPSIQSPGNFVQAAMQRGPILSRTPVNRADVDEPRKFGGSASKNEFDNLSKQIEELLERGRKLRDVKPMPQSLNLTSSFTKPTLNLSPISLTAPILGSTITDEAISNIVALVDATDPIFSSNNLKAPVCTPSPTITPRKVSSKMDRSLPSPSAFRCPPSEHCDLAVKSVCPMSPRRDPDSFAITLRKKNSKVSVEVWDKRSQTLVGLGLGEMSDSSIKCFDVWDDHQVATVTIATKLPSSQPSSVTPSPLISLQSSPCVRVEERPISATSNLGEFLTSRSIKESRRPPSARQSTESFLSFISASPAEIEEPLVVSSDELPDSEPETPIKSSPPVCRIIQSPQRRPNIFDTYVEQLNHSLSSYDESLIIDKLNMDMKELDSLTMRLRGGTDTGSPQKLSVNLPESSARVQPKKVPRRKKQSRRTSSRPAVRRSSYRPPSPSQPASTPLVLESPMSRNISVSNMVFPTQSVTRSSSVCSSRKSVFDPPERHLDLVCDVASVCIDPSPIGVPLNLPPSLESLRKESIEQARRNILALKGSIMSEVYSLEGSSTPRN